MRRVWSAVAIAISLAIAALAVPGVGSAKPPAATKKARTFSGTPTVGALFDSATSKTHFCTASVVASPHGNVLITAAHCVDGSAEGWSYPYTSYSPPLGSHARAVYRRAVTGTTPDVAPKAGSDDCSTGL